MWYVDWANAERQPKDATCTRSCLSGDCYTDGTCCKFLLWWCRNLRCFFGVIVLQSLPKIQKSLRAFHEAAINSNLWRIASPPTSKQKKNEAEINQPRSYHYCMPYFFLNLSTRPPASTSFCLPVKYGWHLLQISTLMMSVSLVVPVLKVAPQAHTTVASWFPWSGNQL